MAINSENSGRNSLGKKAGERMFAGADHLLFRRAAELRNHQTHAEELLWGYLRNKPSGFKFRRQHPYLNFILDFYCHRLNLVIEVDGSIHNEEAVKENDAIRQNHLQDHGLTVLRFTNEEIKLNIEKVIARIEDHFRLSESKSKEVK